MLEALLSSILSNGTGERCVVVSSFTKTLDMVCALCDSKGWATARICGDTGAAKRQDIVTAFNYYGVGQVAWSSRLLTSAANRACDALRIVSGPATCIHCFCYDSCMRVHICSFGLPDMSW